MVETRKHPPHSLMRLYKDRKSLIQAWLRKFGFSDWQVLSEVLGQKPSSITRLIETMIQARHIVRVHNIRTGKTLFRIGSAGLAEISEQMRQENPSVSSHNVLRNDRIARHIHVYHDLAVQRCVVDMSRSIEVIGFQAARDAVLDPKQNKTTPDALLETREAGSIAIEFETFSKSKRAIYRKFHSYRMLIRDEKIDGVAFYFADEAVRIYYQSLFEKRVWPFWYRNSEGRIVLDDSIDGLEVDSDIRQGFLFKTLPLAKHISPNAS